MRSLACSLARSPMPFFVVQFRQITLSYYAVYLHSFFYHKSTKFFQFVILKMLQRKGRQNLVMKLLKITLNTDHRKAYYQLLNEFETVIATCKHKKCTKWLECTVLHGKKNIFCSICIAQFIIHSIQNILSLSFADEFSCAIFLYD